MKNLYIISILLLSIFLSHAHEGNILRIDDVEVKGSCEYIQVNFKIENIDEVPLRNVKIDLRVGDEVLQSKSYDLFPSDKFSNESFVIFW